MTSRQIVTQSTVAVVLLISVAAFGFVNSQNDSPSDEAIENTPLPVETTIAHEVTSFAKRRTFTGVIRATRTSELGFERSGRLISVAVTEGDRVESGQALAQLDAENLKAKQQELTAQRAAANSLLDELKAGPRAETIDAARAEVNDLKSQVELANLNFERRERLLASRATSQEEFEAASLGLLSAKAKLEAATQRLGELEAGTRVERLDAQRAVVAQLDAALANIAIDISESTLRAPFTGVIGKRYLDEGTIASNGEPILRIIEDAEPEAWIGLPSELCATLKSGQTVEINVNQRHYDANLKAVLPELDPTTRTQTAIFDLASSDGLLPAQIARLELEATVEAKGFWVPTTALTRGSRGLWSVLVVEQSETSKQSLAARRAVEILDTNGQEALIRGTLSDGEQVVISGTHRIVAGQAINIQNPALNSESVRQGQQ